MRYLGVDYGSKRVGLALSDEAGTMGFPYAILKNTPRLVDELMMLIEEEAIGAVVIGESRDYRGAENPIMRDVRELAHELGTRTATSIFFEPEVLTSAQARRAPEKEGKSRAPKRRATVDASAAALILTSYLSRTDHG